MTNDQEDHRMLMRSLTTVLNDPNAEWKDIRSAMKAKTGGLKCSTNLAIINASCSGSGGVGPDDEATDLIKVEEGSRRTSVQSCSSNRRPSRRASRRVSRKRSSLRWSSRRSSASLQSSFNFDDSGTSTVSDDMMNLGDSVNMMDFGVSPHLAVLDESLRGCVLDDGTRSCASLNELDQLKEQFDPDHSDEEGRESVGNLDISIRSEGDVDDCVDTSGFMNWPSTPEEKQEGKRDEDQEVNMTTSQTSQESSSSRRPSRRSARRQSRRSYGSHRWSGRSSASTGSSFSFSDSLVSESGFMAWPSAVQEEVVGDLNEVGDGVNDTIEEEHADEVKREEEEWRIEDYEKSTDESNHIQRCLSEGSSGSSALAKTFKLFARAPISNRRASNASSDASLDGTMDLLKIKQTLLSAKKKGQVEEVVVEENDDQKKCIGSMSLISMIQQSLAAEMNKVEVEKESAPTPLPSMYDGGNGPTRRRTGEKAIWMRHNSTIYDDPDVYKKLYAQPPSEAMPAESLEYFWKAK